VRLGKVPVRSAPCEWRQNNPAIEKHERRVQKILKTSWKIIHVLVPKNNISRKAVDRDGIVGTKNR
jgi:hypothetical protein